MWVLFFGTLRFVTCWAVADAKEACFDSPTSCTSHHVTTPTGRGRQAAGGKRVRRAALCAGFAWSGQAQGQQALLQLPGWNLGNLEQTQASGQVDSCCKWAAVWPKGTILVEYLVFTCFHIAWVVFEAFWQVRRHVDPRFSPTCPEASCQWRVGERVREKSRGLLSGF